MNKQYSDEAILTALLRYPTAEQAALAVGCSRSAITRRMAEPEFRAKLEDARRQMVDGCIEQLNAAAAEAARLLVETMNDDFYDVQIRINIAKYVCTMQLKTIQNKIINE